MQDSKPTLEETPMRIRWQDRPRAEDHPSLRIYATDRKKYYISKYSCWVEDPNQSEVHSNDK